MIDQVEQSTYSIYPLTSAKVDKASEHGRSQPILVGKTMLCLA